MRLHHPAEIQGADNIILIIEKRLGDRFAYRLEPGEMDDRINVLRDFEDSIQGLDIQQVGFTETQWFFGQVLTRIRASSLELLRLSMTVTW